MTFKTIKELEAEEISIYWHDPYIQALKDVLGLIDEQKEFCDCGLTNKALKELKERISG